MPALLDDDTSSVAERPYDLEPRWRSLVTRRRFADRTRVLLVNATKGPALYQSMVDFVLLWRSIDPQLHVTSASYFDDIQELGRGVRERGLPILSIENLSRCTLRQLNLLDLIICIGPSELFAQLSTMEGLTARLVLLDLAFYHRLQARADGRALEHVQLASGVPAHNPITAYSTQAAVKIIPDLGRMGIPTPAQRWTWRWLPYLPLGLSRHPCFAVDPPQFDVLLLGAKNRDFSLLDAADLRGLRILFLGKLDHAESLRQTWGHLDLTICGKVPETEYHRLISAAKCVVIPFEHARANCFLSVVDPLAAGTPLLLTRHIGSERLEAAGAPIFFVDRASFRASLDHVLAEDFDRAAHQERSRRFCEASIDIGAILFRILDEQLGFAVNDASEPSHVLEAPCPSSL